MTKEKQKQNIKEIIDLYKNLQLSLNDLLKGVKEDGKERNILDDFLSFIGIEKNKETRYVAYSRIVNLNEEPLVQYLNKLTKKKNNIEKQEYKNRVLNMSYKFVCEFHSEIQAVIISVIDKKELLTPFYIEVFKGVANVGLAFNDFFIPWRNHIINNINKGLEEKFENDTDKIMNFLSENNLFDLGHNGEIADRSYSALVIENGIYESKSYYDVFTREVKSIVEELDNFISKLSSLEDEIYDSKKYYIDYLTAIKEAFLETDTDKLVEKWSKVDKVWMEIKTPFQIGHPLEFYEDKYRKAVAPEWDLRLLNTVFESEVEKGVVDMYEKLSTETGKEKYKSSYDFSLNNLKRVQFYLTSPVLYYSSEMTGIFSAQVVPNDEIVSKKFGKKIFAFPEMILDKKRSSPFMKIDGVIFENKLLEEYRKNIFGKNEIFYKIYDITTIGHEYGHNLWLDEDTQSLMNKKTGVYKKIEEFKATTGGLVSYFLKENDDKNFSKEIIIDHVYRTVNLLKYREVNEIEPYYCEALIHLSILFESGIIFVNLDKKVELHFTKDSYDKLKINYLTHYKKLVKIYLDKIDAGEFLNDYTVKKNGHYLPKDDDIREFVEYFYDVYKKIGNEIDNNK